LIFGRYAESWDILSSPLARKEAELFSKIEGTQSIMNEVL
jgi:hypothetical protein